MSEHLIRTFLPAALVFATGLVAPAQENLESKLEEIEVDDRGKTRWEPGVFFGMESNAGNTDTLTLNAGASLDGAIGDHEIRLAGEGSYGEESSDTTTEKFDGEAQYNWVFDDPWYAYARNEFNYDQIALIDYRLILSPGLGRYIVQNDTWDLALEAGPGYLWEKVADVSDDGPTARFAQRYHRTVTENTTVFQQIEFLPRIDDFGDYILDGQIGIDAAMGGGFSTRIAIKDRYDPEPGEGLEENDVQVIAGIIYKIAAE